MEPRGSVKNPNVLYCVEGFLMVLEGSISKPKGPIFQSSENAITVRLNIYSFGP